MSRLITRCSRPTIVAASALAALLVPSTVRAGLIMITKTETISIPGTVTGGRAKVFATADDNAVQQYSNPPGVAWTVAGNGNSLNTITATKTVGNYSGTAQATVGSFAQVGNRLQGTATLFASTSTPPTPPPNGGFAAAFSFVSVRGMITAKQITNGAGVTVTDPTLIGQFKDTARDGGANVLDPIYVDVYDEETGQNTLQEVYNNKFESVDGGQVGFNGSGNLELSTDDDGPASELASYASSTDDAGATNLTGTASLQGGVLDLTGIFSNLADWTISQDASGYIYDAVFNDSAELDEIDFSLPQLTDPNTSPTDTVDYTITTSLRVGEAAPEPTSLSVIGVGLLALYRLSRRIARKS